MVCSPRLSSIPMFSRGERSYKGLLLFVSEDRIFQEFLETEPEALFLAREHDDDLLVRRRGLESFCFVPFGARGDRELVTLTIQQFKISAPVGLGGNKTIRNRRTGYRPTELIAHPAEDHVWL